MSRDQLIDRLATLAGIEFSYYDIAGTRHEASLEVKAALLAAMGFDPSSDASLAAGIADAEDGPWRRRLGPALILATGGRQAALEISLPARLDREQFAWAIELEEGGRQHGEFRGEEVEAVEGRQIDGDLLLRRRLTLDAPLPPGYHRFILHGPDRVDDALLIAAPPRCYLPPILQQTDAKLWIVSAQLYAVRSQRNWGMGDLGDLAQLVTQTAEAGAAGVALNPLHALFPGVPTHASPYSPSSRLFLNPLYIDVMATPGFISPHAKEAAGLDTTLNELRQAPLIDYQAVANVKLPALEETYRNFRRLHPSDDARRGALDESFRAFQTYAGAALRHFAVFQVLDEAHSKTPGRRVSWTDWGEAYRSPISSAVLAFANAHADRVDFHEYLQWQMDEQLAAAAARSRERGMAIGLCRDLAIGVDAGGADAWSLQDVLVEGARIGAPPDDFNVQGQEWGILPMNPLALRQQAFRPFTELLRSNMRHAGAIRIDHIIGFQRQFFVPAGAKAVEGAYVRYPFDELLAITALESHRSGCMVIGEDLGTVPEGFRERMRAAGALGTCVLYFEKTAAGQFRLPANYPELAVASVATHDLPTLAGYWEGRDIAFRKATGNYTSIEADRVAEMRRQDRAALMRALVECRLITVDAGEGPTVPEGMDSTLARAIHLFLAAARARILSIQLDDILGELDQINMPGTVHEYPNWRRKLSRDLEDPEMVRSLHAFAERLRAARPS
jgi:(1->4)-alpha-D-glucan 1-alpha-D-glucosylmutase